MRENGIFSLQEHGASLWRLFYRDRVSETERHGKAAKTIPGWGRRL
jgi:hypothetical protein